MWKVETHSSVAEWRLEVDEVVVVDRESLAESMASSVHLHLLRRAIGKASWAVADTATIAGSDCRASSGWCWDSWNC